MLVRAQGTAASSLAGVVVDSNGGVIPGATVEIKNDVNRTKIRTSLHNAQRARRPHIFSSASSVAT